MGATTTTTISIGRNVPMGHAMPEEEWQAFTGDLVRIVTSHSQAVHFIGFGQGIWQGDEEEALTVVAAVLLPNLGALKLELSKLARTYAQEAIAVTSGSTRFAYAMS